MGTDLICRLIGFLFALFAVASPLVFVGLLALLSLVIAHSVCGALLALQGTRLLRRMARFAASLEARISDLDSNSEVRWLWPPGSRLGVDADGLRLRTLRGERRIDIDAVTAVVVDRGQRRYRILARLRRGDLLAISPHLRGPQAARRVGGLLSEVLGVPLNRSPSPSDVRRSAART